MQLGFIFLFLMMYIEQKRDNIKNCIICNFLVMSLDEQSNYVPWHSTLVCVLSCVCVSHPGCLCSFMPVAPLCGMLLCFLKPISLVSLFFFSVLFCHTASSIKPFPSTGTSLLSSVESDYHPSLTNMQPEVLSSAGKALVMMLPPFLSDQAQIVVIHGSFHLFCQAIGEL